MTSLRVAQVVLLPSPAGLPESLTYLVPDPLAPGLDTGTPVLVPLGGREQLGYVLELSELASVPENLRLRPIAGIARPDPAFDARTVALLRAVARDCCCSLADALPLAVPERYGAELQPQVSLAAWDGAIPPRVGLLTRRTLEAIHQALTAAGGTLTRAALEDAVRALNLVPALRRARAEGWVTEERVLLPPKVRARTVKSVALTPEGEAAARGAALPGRTLGERQRQVLGWLLEHGPAAQSAVAGGAAHAAVRALARRGLVAEGVEQVRRAPGGLGRGRDTAPPLTPFQGAATDAIQAALGRGEGETLLLFGVTGSGKTEVYLDAIQRARDAGRTALLLVPEISLTAQVAAAVRRRLGDEVAILHSALSEGERFDEWERVRRGAADVVVGPRSALFAPLKDPALVILDEEHDGSYKQSSPAPRYHARDAARERARLCGGCTVLGSATPSLESFHAAQTGAYRLLELPERVRQRPLPAVDVVDLREESRARPGAVFGRHLEDSMRRRLDEGEQVILFLNRRGYSAFLLCRDCGHVPHCPNCDVSLTLHRREAGTLLCHHCEYTRRAPAACPHCLGPRLRQFGLGTQRVEEAVRELFPRARVARLDRDSTATKNAHTRIVESVLARDVDVLVGTQMVTKGFDFPGVTLVGVVTADVALNVPDFRAAERAFQLLTQVSGRAGRGERTGEVVVQTFSPEHPSIQAASRHDYRGFYAREIAAREELGYPPFGSIARLVASHAEEAVARGRIETAAALVRPRAGDARVLGPAPCPLARLKDRYRFHLLLKGASRAALRAVVEASWPEIVKKVGGITVDIEPQDLL